MTAFPFAPLPPSPPPPRPAAPEWPASLAALYTRLGGPEAAGRTVPTGLPFLDGPLGGGHASGEVYGVIGATGCGKSFLALQIAFETARYQQFAAAQGAPLGQAFVVDYEMGLAECRLRLNTLAAQVHQTSLEERFSVPLSETGRLKDYEEERWRDKLLLLGPGPVEGERERLQRAGGVLKRNLTYVDFSGPGESPQDGAGYVPEIARRVAREAAELGRRPAVVVIDYAGICVARHVGNPGRGIDRTRELLTGFADACRVQIAARFGCPVWVFHQLSGAANQPGFALKLSHTDAMESKSFGHNLSFCFVISGVERSTGCVRLGCTKARRTEVQGRETLLYIDGSFGALVEPPPTGLGEAARGGP
jgi:hypothetical protein